MKLQLCLSAIIFIKCSALAFQLPEEFKHLTRLNSACNTFDTTPSGFIKYITDHPEKAEWANDHLRYGCWNCALILDIDSFWNIYTQHEAFFKVLRRWMSTGIPDINFPRGKIILTFLQSHPELEPFFTQLLDESKDGGHFVYSLLINLRTLGQEIHLHGTPAFINLFSNITKELYLFNHVFSELNEPKMLHLQFSLLNYILQHPENIQGTLNIMTEMLYLTSINSPLLVALDQEAEKEFTPLGTTGTAFIQTTNPFLSDFFFFISAGWGSAYLIADFCTTPLPGTTITDRLRGAMIMASVAPFILMMLHGQENHTMP